MLSEEFREKETVLERRPLARRSPRKKAPSRESMAEIRRSERKEREEGKTGVGTKREIASARPTMAGRFSVPPRRSFSWAPPKIIGEGLKGDLQKRRPTPLGP